MPTGRLVMSALILVLLSGCRGGEEGPRPSPPDAAQPAGPQAAFGDGAVPDTTHPEEPQYPSPSAREEPAAGGSPSGENLRPPSTPSPNADMWDTAPSPGMPGHPGTSDTQLVTPAGPGVMDTAIAGPVVGPQTLWQPMAGTLDTAAAVMPSRGGAAARARPLPGVHR